MFSVATKTNELIQTNYFSLTDSRFTFSNETIYRNSCFGKSFLLESNSRIDSYMSEAVVKKEREGERECVSSAGSLVGTCKNRLRKKVVNESGKWLTRAQGATSGISCPGDIYCVEAWIWRRGCKGIKRSSSECGLGVKCKTNRNFKEIHHQKN